jgi:hypothetical protein
MSNIWHFNGYPRLMARIGEDSPIELCRAKPGNYSRATFECEARSVMKQLTGPWTTWIEHTTSPFYLISARPKLRFEVDGMERDRRGKLRLTTMENKQLESEHGLQPDYLT